MGPIAIVRTVSQTRRCLYRAESIEQNTKAILTLSLIRILITGAETSLNGSLTISPKTAGLAGNFHIIHETVMFINKKPNPTCLFCLQFIWMNFLIRNFTQLPQGLTMSEELPTQETLEEHFPGR